MVCKIALPEFEPSIVQNISKLTANRKGKIQICATIFGMPADRLFTYVISSRSRGVVKSVREMVREQGIGTFYRGSSAFFLRVVPIFVLYFPLYEQARKLLGLGFMD